MWDRPRQQDGSRGLWVSRSTSCSPKASGSPRSKEDHTISCLNWARWEPCGGGSRGHRGSVQTFPDPQQKHWRGFPGAPGRPPQAEGASETPPLPTSRPPPAALALDPQPARPATTRFPGHSPSLGSCGLHRGLRNPSRRSFAVSAGDQSQARLSGGLIQRDGVLARRGARRRRARRGGVNTRERPATCQPRWVTVPDPSLPDPRVGRSQFPLSHWVCGTCFGRPSRGTGWVIPPSAKGTPRGSTPGAQGVTPQGPGDMTLLPSQLLLVGGWLGAPSLAPQGGALCCSAGRQKRDGSPVCGFNRQQPH